LQDEKGRSSFRESNVEAIAELEEDEEDAQGSKNMN
jgi:hypothetical protein